MLVDYNLSKLPKDQSTPLGKRTTAKNPLRCLWLVKLTSNLDLPRRSVPSAATHENEVLNALYCPLYLRLALFLKHLTVLASPRISITGGSRASSSNRPSLPVCLPLTV